jgi:hypothetical protein
MASTKSCPRCAEKVQIAALVCKHCGYNFSDEEIASSRQSQKVDSWIKFGVLGVVVFALVKCVGGDSPNTATSNVEQSAYTAVPEAELEKFELTLDRFSWENSGDRYCNADAKLTNTGTVTLKFTRMKLQFLKNGSLQGSEESYLDVTELAPGQSSTWDAMYECPGNNTSVEITATTRGTAVSIVDPPKKTKKRK